MLIELNIFLIPEKYCRFCEKKIAINMEVIAENTVIEPNVVCSEKHRAFFIEKIGKSFSFNVLFQKWLKSNAD